MKYRNMSNNTYSVKDIDGFNVSVKPGEYVESYIFYAYDDFEVVDLDGVYNPVVKNTIFTSTEEASDHILHIDTKLINIIRITGTITVKPQYDTAVPFLLDYTADDPIIDIQRPQVWYTKLRISGVGTCNIIEFRE